MILLIAPFYVTLYKPDRATHCTRGGGMITIDLGSDTLQLIPEIDKLVFI